MAFWEPAEKMTYYVFFPALLVGNTASAGLGGLQAQPMALALVAGAVLCKVFGVDGLTATVVVMYATSPGPPSSYVLARQMGGGAKLMAAIITVTTLAAMAAMPLALHFMSS